MAQHDQVIANASGAVVRGDINDALAAIFSLSSGATAPGTTVAYQLWADTTTGLLKQRNAANSAWVTLGTLAAYKLGLSTVGTAIDDDDIDGDNILTLPTDGNVFAFTGTQTVDEIASVGVGTEIELHFGSARTLTHSADLVLPGGANITTADGDVAKFREYAPGDWRCTSYVQAATGAYLVAASDSVAGKVELATAAEAKARTDTARATTPGSLATFGQFATGSYTGDGSTSRAITGVGFQPKCVMIIAGGADGAASRIHMTTNTLMARDAQGLAAELQNGGGVVNQDNRIISLDADGFTVSDDSGDNHPNQTGVAYDWMAWG